MADRSSGLARAVRATSSPRHGLSASAHERFGARRERRRLLGVGLATLVALLAAAAFFLWEVRHATGLTYSHWGPLGPAAGNDYDEGAYVVSAQLLLKGYALFSQVFSAQPAFFLPSLAVVLRLVGDPAVGGHVYVALFGLLTLAGVFWMGATAYGAASGALAVALLAVSPGFLLYGHAVEAEMPMLGLCTLAVAAAQSYYLWPRRLSAALAGLLLLAGSEMKLLSVVVALPLALFLLAGAWRARRTGRASRDIALDALAFILCVAAPALLIMLLVAPAQQLRQVVTFHLAASTVMPLNSRANLAALRDFLLYDQGLLAAAVVGAVLCLWRQRDRYLTVVYGVWLLSTLAFLWRYHPLLQHQFIPLLPPLALLASALAAPLIWRPARRTVVATRGPRVRPAALVATITIVVYLVVLDTRTLVIDRRLLVPSVTPRRDRLIALIDRSTAPTDFVVCDDPMVALGAHRVPPPGLEDPSIVRTVAGYLTVSDAEASTRRYHAAAIVASRPMFALFLPAYLSWAQRNYRQVPITVPNAQVYLRR